MQSSTLEDLKGLETAKRGRVTRRLGFAMMLVLILVSFTGVFGPSRESVTTTDGFIQLRLSYGSVVRSGQAVPLRITVSREGGFQGPITLVFDRDVFDRFDFQNWYPNPSAETAGPGEVTYEFDPPDGDVLTVALDARVAPTQLGGRFEYSVHLDVDGVPTAETNYAVWVMP